MIHRNPRQMLAALLAAMLILSQTACTAQTGQTGSAQGKTSFAEDWLLNTYCYIQIYEEGKEDLIREAFARARGYENLLSRTIETSDIGRFNASDAGCQVQPETKALLQDCVYAYELSEGLLDVTIGAVSSLWDFGAEDPEAPDEPSIEEALAHVGNWDDLDFGQGEGNGEGDTGWIGKDDPGILLDLGAVAKGYIAHRTADYLRAEGVSRAVVNFGGNVVFIGKKENGSLWNCGIEDPSEGQSEDLIQERGTVGSVHVFAEEGGAMSVVTSGTYERCFEQDGTLYHHVLDPRTGYPAETDLLSATIIGPSSELCDMLSTTCLLFGSEKGMALIEAQDGFEAVFILADGTILQSSGAQFTE